MIEVLVIVVNGQSSSVNLAESWYLLPDLVMTRCAEKRLRYMAPRSAPNARCFSLAIPFMTQTAQRERIRSNVYFACTGLYFGKIWRCLLQESFSESVHIKI
jgi:hypothetical protein